ncbi:MAG: glycine oxidase [Micromonosporaceae bacterium]|nr:glycine oxidase [Micromonosporaceae bacterium]
MTTVGIVGGGIIGLAIGWRCARLGLDVTVYDGQPAKASAVAAGMLAPTTETHPGERALHRLLGDSARRWPAFAAQLGGDVGYREEGTLLVAVTDDDLAEVRRLCARATTGTYPLTAAQLRDREPALSPRVRGGAFAPGDRQVDPRRVLAALQARVKVEPRQISDVSTIDADIVVIAAGAATASLTGLPIRPVKGQTVRLRAPRPPVRHVIRGFVRSRSVYVVPRDDGELIIGATEEERGADTTVTAGGVLDLLRPASELLPGIAEYEVTEVVAGLRPGTPDNAPYLGVLHDNVIVAAGHHRNGVLLAPVTADAIATLVATGVPPAEITPFRPTRGVLCA